MPECERCIGKSILYANNMYEAVLDADALLLATEWKEFRIPNWNLVKKVIKQHIVIDGRNIYEWEEMKKNGFQYNCIGRKIDAII